jgi:type VI secretion system protein VasD
LLLAGCAAGPRVSEPATLTIRLQAAADVNPDLRGRASPLDVRLFELRSASAFEAADFFALYDRDQATLAADLLAREQIVVQPGEVRTLRRQAKPETRHLGVIAAYRDLERSVWRASVSVAPPTEAPRVIGAVVGAKSHEQAINLALERSGLRVVRP